MRVARFKFAVGVLLKFYCSTQIERPLTNDLQYHEENENRNIPASLFKGDLLDARARPRPLVCMNAVEDGGQESGRKQCLVCWFFVRAARAANLAGPASP